MGENGGGESIRELKKQALVHLSKELSEAKLPAVLSSYMSTEKLPAEYRGIDEYVRGVREKMITEVGGNLTQLQTIVMDGICELLIVIKYISIFIAGNPAKNIVAFDRFGIPHPSDMVIKGLAGLHQALDKKIKQFNDMTSEQKDEMSPREIHRRAIMGEYDKPKTGVVTGRPIGSQKHNAREKGTGRFVKQQAEEDN